jgi:hypothetical protein
MGAFGERRLADFHLNSRAHIVIFEKEGIIAWPTENSLYKHEKGQKTPVCTQETQELHSKAPWRSGADRYVGCQIDARGAFQALYRAGYGLTLGYPASMQPSHGKQRQAFLETVQERLLFSLKAVQVDGGSEFMAEFEQACQEKNIRLFVLPPQSPKLNGCEGRAVKPQKIVPLISRHFQD